MFMLQRGLVNPLCQVAQDKQSTLHDKSWDCKLNPLYCFKHIIIGIQGGLYGKVSARKSANYGTLRYVIVELNHPEVEIPPRTFLLWYVGSAAA